MTISRDALHRIRARAGSAGGEARAERHTHEEMSGWSALGGRPRLPTYSDLITRERQRLEARLKTMKRRNGQLPASRKDLEELLEVNQELALLTRGLAETPSPASPGGEHLESDVIIPREIKPDNRLGFLKLKCPTGYDNCPTCHVFNGRECKWGAFRQGATHVPRQDMGTDGITFEAVRP